MTELRVCHEVRPYRPPASRPRAGARYGRTDRSAGQEQGRATDRREVGRPCRGPVRRARWVGGNENRTSATSGASGSAAARLATGTTERWAAHHDVGRLGRHDLVEGRHRLLRLALREIDRGRLDPTVAETIDSERSHAGRRARRAVAEIAVEGHVARSVAFGDDRRTDLLLVVALQRRPTRSADGRVPRHGVGGTHPRRPRALRASRARILPGGPVLVDDPQQARVVPCGVPRIRAGRGRGFRRHRSRAR